MKKLFTLSLLALCFVSLAYSAAYNVQSPVSFCVVDDLSTMPIPTVFSTMSFDEDAQTLTLTDTSAYAAQSTNRLYRIRVYTRRNGGHLYYFSGRGFEKYTFGYISPSVAEYDWEDEFEVETCLTTIYSTRDGVIDMQEAVSTLRQSGCAHFYIAVEPTYSINGQSVEPFGTYNYFVNHIATEIEPIKVKSVETSVWNPSTNIPKTDFNSNEYIRVMAEVESTLPFTLIFATYNYQDGQPTSHFWTTGSEGPYTDPVLYTKTSFCWDSHREFNEGDSAKVVVLATNYTPTANYMYEDAWGWRYSEVASASQVITFRYPVYVDGVLQGYYQPGTTVTLPLVDNWAECSPVSLTDSVGGGYHFTKDASGHVQFVMPTRALYAVQYVQQYEVRFVDYDGSILKTQKVACGSSATAPVIRSSDHPGLTFSGWEGTYNNVHSDGYVYAKYAELASPYFSTCNLDITRGSKVGTGLDEVMINDTLLLSYSVIATTTERSFSVILRYRYDNETDWRTSSIQSCNNLRATTGITGTSNFRIANNTLFSNRSRMAYQLMVVTSTADTIYGQPYNSRITYPITVNTNYDVYAACNDTMLLIPSRASSGAYTTLPIAMGDSIIFYSVDGRDACLSTGVSATDDSNVGRDADGQPFYICKGAPQTCDMTMDYNRVIFRLNGGHLVDSLGVALTDTAILRQNIWCMDDAQDPGQPVREGYNFCGWDRSFNKVNGDITINAQWCDTALTYHTVTFYYPDSTTVRYRAQVVEGQSAKEPYMQALQVDDKIYLFDHWNGDFTNVTSDRDIYAVYTLLVMDSIEDIPAEILQGGARKLLINGVIYIVRDGQVYDAQGRRLQ